MWVVEDSTFDRDSTERLIASLEKQGIPYVPYDYKLFKNWKDIHEDLQPILGERNDSVISYGSLNFITRFQKIGEYKPGTYCDFRGLECRSYYNSELYPHLLNQRHMLVTWKEFQDDEDGLFRAFGGQIFVRPNSGRKVFTGMVFFQDSYRSDLGLSLERLEDSTILLLAPAQIVTEEWRFFVTGGRVITGGKFHEKGELSIEDTVDKQAESLAELASTLYVPDPVFVIDIGKTSYGDYKVIELNSFSCAGIYECNTDKLVKEVTEIYTGS